MWHNIKGEIINFLEYLYQSTPQSEEDEISNMEIEFPHRENFDPLEIEIILAEEVIHKYLHDLEHEDQKKRKKQKLDEVITSLHHRAFKKMFQHCFLSAKRCMKSKIH